MKRLGRGVLLLSCLMVAAQLQAQEGPPKGPGDIIKRAQQARQKPALLQDGKPVEAAAQPRAAEGLPEGHPTTEEAGAPPPVGDDPHAHQEGAPPLERRALSEAAPNPGVPAGTIRVRVL